MFGIDLVTSAVAGRSGGRYISGDVQKDVLIEYSGPGTEYFFKTREGGTGFLELKGQSRDSGGHYLSIRYEFPSMKGVVLSGRVLSEPGGQGVEGLPLVCQTGLGIGLYATTDAKGWYRFEPVEADSRERSMNVWIEQEAQEPGTWRPGVRVDVADKDIWLDDICLSLGQSIRGTVRNAKTGVPVGAGVRIRINKSPVPMRSLRTDANGRYCFYVLPGSYTLWCRGSEDRYYGAGDGYGREGIERAVSVEAGQVVEGFDFEVQEASSYSGVVELPDGRAAVGAEVFVRSHWSPEPNRGVSINSHGGSEYMWVRI